MQVWLYSRPQTLKTVHIVPRTEEIIVKCQDITTRGCVELNHIGAEHFKDYVLLLSPMIILATSFY